MELAIKFICAFCDACGKLTATFQANPLGASLLLVLAAIVVFGLWLHKQPPKPKKPIRKPQANKRRASKPPANGPASPPGE